MRSVLRTLKMSLNALRRNLMRSALTTLGIVIGVAAVIAMTEIGQGNNTAVRETMMRMGSNVLQVQSGAASSGGVNFGSGTLQTLTPQDADAIARECSAVSAAAPLVRIRPQIVYGNKNWVPIYLYGTTPAFLEIRDWTEPDLGETLTNRDVINQAKVCMIGQTIVRNLFGDEDPIGKELRVQNVALKVIGTLPRKGANMMGIDQDDILLAPWTTIKFRVSGASANPGAPAAQTPAEAAQKVNALGQLYPGQGQPLYPTISASQVANTPVLVRFTNIDQILVEAASTEEIPVAIDQINGLLRQRHRIKPGQPEDFNIRDMTEMNKAQGSISEIMSRALVFVAMVSLVVGGVGIMNIMLVSVTQRTREIGLRMAVGARARDILRQFLIESVVLCLLGGFMGIVLGLLSAYLVHRFLGWPTEHSVLAVVAAVGVSVAVGLIFGYYPAWKASRLDPIDALRYE